jgi:glycogen debranching enzyme
MPVLSERAVAVLRGNDRGGFVRPGRDLYPFQWNWDAAFVALGLAHVDAERGRLEVRSLLRGQWADGMVPHIVFHIEAPEYAPGPELWDSRRSALAPAVPTSGLTQPPVLATAVRRLHEAAPDRRFLEQTVPALERWHRWLHEARGADDSGLVAILHPWESADNSPRFDRALARLEQRDGVAVRRSDRREVPAAERPTDRDYRAYMLILDDLRAQEYRPESPAAAPFSYVDLSFNSILAVAETDLAFLWRELGECGDRALGAAERMRSALAARWHDDDAAYGGGEPGADAAASKTVDDLLPLYAGVPDAAQARRLWQERLWASEHFGPSRAAPWAVTSASKSSPAFDSRRYWRGPVWINVTGSSSAASSASGSTRRRRSCGG